MTGAVAPAPALHDSGEGPALLMLHAFPLDASQWDHQVAALSGDHRCLRPDMWGCGASPPPPGTAPSLDDFAMSVLQKLDDRGIERFAVLASSMGGYIAFALWRLARQRITALVLASTRSGADTEQRRSEREEQAQHVLADGNVDDVVETMTPLLVAPRHEQEAHIIDPLRGRIRRCTPQGIAYCLRAMAARPDSTSDAQLIDAPTLVLIGAEDRLIPPEQTRLLAQQMPAARPIELAGCGHMPNLERPEEFSAAVADFLRALPT